MPDADITAFAEWIATTRLSLLIGPKFWAIPTIQSLHILSLAMVFASAMVIDLRILGLISNDQPLSKIVRRHIPGVWIALICAAITGSLLLIAEPARSLLAWEFQIKMVMLFAVIVITLVFQRLIAVRAAEWDAVIKLPMAARLAAVISMGLWMLIIVAGRWIAYHAG